MLRTIAGPLCLLASLGAGPPLPALERQATEYQVKAAFLLNFTKFIEWPGSLAGGTDAPMGICIWGDDPFGRILDQIVEGENVNGRHLMVLRVRRQNLKSCKVVFVGRTEKEVPKVLSELGPGVLTVGDGDAFLREGGMIAFVVENRRVRFDVNQSAAANAGLKISSKLLSVARAVER